jgi:molybdate transport system regulatory protein
MPHLSIRIDFDDEGRLGPGKVALLEGIAREGSISAAGRAMNMSYKRAWELVRHYRAIERKALSATASHLKALQAISRSRRRK